MLRIFNTLTKRKEVFYPLFKNIVNIYVCGITVYDHCHIGHARTFTVFDMIIRCLQYYKYNVRYVRNITDVDDKIIKSARLNHESVSNLTHRMIVSMNEDFLNLGLIQPNYAPRVTDQINNIIIIIQKLIRKNHAYIAKNGDVLFSIRSYQDYGILSRQKINFLKKSKQNMKDKNSDRDFVLWKILDASDKPNWDSPWGLGRPGWHIECSTINDKYFGKNLDIHGGGIDLLFPHHENERAQSVCLHGNDYGKYWIHVGSLLINKKKMSKTLNNTIFLNKLLKIYDPEIIRYYFLLTHYRKPLLYNVNNLNNSIISLRKLYMVLDKIDLNHIVLRTQFSLKYQFFCTNFYHAICDDFNTPHAISILFSLLKKINISLKEKKQDIAMQLLYQLKYLSNIIGLLNQNPLMFLKKTSFIFEST